MSSEPQAAYSKLQAPSEWKVNMFLLKHDCYVVFESVMLLTTRLAVWLLPLNELPIDFESIFLKNLSSQSNLNKSKLYIFHFSCFAFCFLGVKHSNWRCTAAINHLNGEFWLSHVVYNVKNLLSIWQTINRSQPSHDLAYHKIKSE